MVITIMIIIGLGNDWVENAPRFAGMHIVIGGKKIAITSIPGEGMLTYHMHMI
jgi:hypothetical protein